MHKSLNRSIFKEPGGVTGSFLFPVAPLFCAKAYNGTALASAALVAINERRLSEALSVEASGVFSILLIVLCALFFNGAKLYFIAFLVQEEVQLKHVTQRDVSTFILEASIASVLHERSQDLHLLHAFLSIDI